MMKLYSLLLAAAVALTSYTSGAATPTYSDPFKMMDVLYKEGICCNLSQFPAVSAKNAGLRIALTRHHSIQDINKLLEVVSHNLPTFMAQENFGYEELYKAFKIADPRAAVKTDVIDGFRRKIA